EAVAEIDLARQVVLVEVGLEFFQHAADGAIDDCASMRILEGAGEAGSAALLQQAEQAGVGNHRELDDLAYPVFEVAAMKSAEQAAVEQHLAGRLEAAEAVLVAVEIDTGLDADRGIDVTHQRGRHLDVRHPAPVAGGGETDHVGKHAAADGNDGLIASVKGKTIELAQYAQPGF